MATAPHVVDLTSLDNESDVAERREGQLVHSFFIPLQPVPMPRVRRGRGGTFYNPARSRIQQLRNFLVELLQQQQLTAPLFAADTPISLSLLFRRQRPLSHFVGNSRTNALRANVLDDIHVGTPDLDNLEKLFMDAFTGILYEDDRQVFFKCSCRLWADRNCSDGSTIVKVKAVARSADVAEYCCSLFG